MCLTKATLSHIAKRPNGRIFVAGPEKNGIHSGSRDTTGMHIVYIVVTDLQGYPLLRVGFSVPGAGTFLQFYKVLYVVGVDSL